MHYRLPILALAFLCSTAFAQDEGAEAPSITSPDDAEPVTEAPESGVVEDRIVEERRDVLTMPQMPAEPAPPRTLPHRGMSMSEVERHFGAPASRHPAVGQPPITRWDYDGYSVFFEHRTVLHAVQKDRPAEIYRKDELLPASSR